MLADADLWYKPHMLRSARERVRMTHLDVARASEQRSETPGCSRINATDLAEWEVGEGEPSLADMDTLADIYQCSVSYFFLDEEPNDDGGVRFRRVVGDEQDPLSSDTLITLERFRRRVEWTSSLLTDLGLVWNVYLEPAGVSPNLDEIAQRERRRLNFGPTVHESWRTPADAFAWWRRRIESLGVFVFEMRLNPKDVRGAAVWPDGGPPFILVNKDNEEANTGRLFTLLHEYAHLLFSQPGYLCNLSSTESERDLERRANAVAVRMLVERGEFLEVLTQLGLNHYSERWFDSTLKRIQSRLFVSRDVVAILLEQQRLAPKGFYRARRAVWDTIPFCRSWGRGGRRPSKAEQLLLDYGSSTARLVLHPAVREVVPHVVLCEMFDTKVERLDLVLTQLRSGVGPTQL